METTTADIFSKIKAIVKGPQGELFTKLWIASMSRWVMNTSPQKTWPIFRVGWMRSSGVNTLPGKIAKAITALLFWRFYNIWLANKQFYGIKKCGNQFILIIPITKL